MFLYVTIHPDFSNYVLLIFWSFQMDTEMLKNNFLVLQLSSSDYNE